MKLLYTLLITCFTLSVSFGQNVKRPLITKRTATWCPSCGGWGWTFMKDIIDEVEGDALVLSTHFSGDLQDQLNVDIANAFGGSGQPQFFLNGVNQGANSGNTADKLTQIRESVTAINEETPEFIIQLEAEYGFNQDGEIAIYAKTKVIPEASLNDGVYSLGVYLVRDDINGPQSGQSGLVDHYKVISRNMTSSSFGDEFPGDTGPAEDITYILFHDTDIDMTRTQVATIIWKDIDGQKEVVNTLSSDITEIISSNDDVATAQFTAYQTADGSINVEASSSIVSAKLMDQHGRLIQEQNGTDKVLTIEPVSQNTGNYILVVQTDQGLQSQLIFLR